MRTVGHYYGMVYVCAAPLVSSISMQATLHCLRSMATARRRQLDELEALAALYPEEGAFEVDDEALAIARSLADADMSPLDQARGTAVPLSCSLMLREGGDATSADADRSGFQQAYVKLTATLSPCYPAEAATIAVSGPLLSTDEHKLLQFELDQMAAEAAASEGGGREVLFELASAAQETLRAAVSRRQRHPATTEAALHADDGICAAHAQPCTQAHTRARRGARMIWFHHIKSPEKRRRIVEAARGLELRGCCKPGFPGVVIVCGTEAACTDFVDEIRSLRWQAMDVRWEDSWEDARKGAREGAQRDATAESGGVSDQRHLHTTHAGSSSSADEGHRARALGALSMPFVELPESEMGQVAAMCEAAGLAAHFREAILKLPSLSKGATHEAAAAMHEAVRAPRAVSASQDPPWISGDPLGSKLQLLIRPGAQASGLRSMHDLNAGAETTELQVDIHAAAREGEANAEVIKVFAELVRVPKLQVQLAVGTRKSRSKTIIIQGLSPQQVLARLRQNCK